MITKIGGRVSLKRIARYCGECAVWYWRRLWLSIYCPCCHKKLTDELKNPIIPSEIRMIKWNLKNRDRRNKYKSEWAKAKRKKLKLKCPAQTSVNSSELPSVKQITLDIPQKENGVRIAAFG